MNKKILITIIVIVMLIIIIVNQLNSKEFDDIRESGLPYRNSCTVVTNDTTRIVYFSINRIYESTDCENSKIDKNKCKSGKKIYFKKLTKDKYKKLKKCLNELSLESQWVQRCSVLEKMINN